MDFEGAREAGGSQQCKWPGSAALASRPLSAFVGEHVHLVFLCHLMFKRPAFYIRACLDCPKVSVARCEVNRSGIRLAKERGPGRFEVNDLSEKLEETA